MKRIFEASGMEKRRMRRAGELKTATEASEMKWKEARNIAKNMKNLKERWKYRPRKRKITFITK